METPPGLRDTTTSPLVTAAVPPAAAQVAPRSPEPAGHTGAEGGHDGRAKEDEARTSAQVSDEPPKGQEDEAEAEVAASDATAAGTPATDNMQQPRKKTPSGMTIRKPKTTVPDRKKRRVQVPGEWAPENVFDIIQHTSYPTRMTLGGDDGLIREGDDPVTPKALEPVLPHERKRIRNAASSSPISTERKSAGVHTLLSPTMANDPPLSPATSAAEPSSQEPSLQKMSISTLLDAPAPTAPEVSAMSINDIINAPGNDDNILDAEEFFNLALSAEGATSTGAEQHEDDEVRQEWDRLSNFLQEEQKKIKSDTDKNSAETTTQEDKQSVNALSSNEMKLNMDEPTSNLNSADRAEAKQAPEDTELSIEKDLQAMAGIEPYESSEEESADDYIEGGKGKTKKPSKSKSKGKAATQRKSKSSGSRKSSKISPTVRKSVGRRNQQTETDEAISADSELLQLKLQKLAELHRRECTKGRETGCQFCSVLDCKLGSEEHYRKELEGGCACSAESDLTSSNGVPYEEVSLLRSGRTRCNRRSVDNEDATFEEQVTHLDTIGKGEKRKRFEVEDFNYPEELPVATLKLDSTKAVIDKTLAKEGKSVSSGYWKDPYNWSERTFINCDLRYYNLASLGKFDAILIDPPWRIKGNQLISNEKTMFNNSKWVLSYGTLSNDEIIDIDVGCLSDKGFIFLWVINSQIEFGFKCLQKWGYTYVDRITWVKKTASSNIAISQGYYFLHSSEICLVGVKYDSKGKSLEFISKTSNDVLFAEIREKSRKPDQLYHIIERMVPGGRKVEIFARNHNMRPGWLSLGNQLGEYYDWDRDLIRCDMCSGSIPTGKTRYKSRTVADSDLCAACYQKSGGTPDQYFEIENIMSEMAFHQYFACDGCETKPLWGLRFHCQECDDCDLCEICYDKKVLPSHLKHSHRVDHKFEVIEMPDLAGGLPVHHEYRCMGCQTKPIIGYRFVCLKCNGLSLCQKCFFLRKEPRTHKATHNMDIIVDSNIYDQFKCAVCALFPIKPVVYKCKSCYNYDLCERCHDERAPPPATNTSHKPSHKFKKITVNTE